MVWGGSSGVGSGGGGVCVGWGWSGMGLGRVGWEVNGKGGKYGTYLIHSCWSKVFLSIYFLIF